MADAVVDVFNLALNAVGARSNLSAPTERDRGAEVCRLWYPIVRDQVLRAAPWPSCRKARRLALLAQRGDEVWDENFPEPYWTYAYTIPDDMLYPRHLTDWTRFDLGTIGDQQVILTDTLEAVLTYTFRQPTVQRWETSLTMAIVYGLAANIVMPLAAKPSRASLLVQQANDLILGARVEAANEANVGYESLPDWITARGYGNPIDFRFIYPSGALLAVAAPVSNVR